MKRKFVNLVLVAVIILLSTNLLSCGGKKSFEERYSSICVVYNGYGRQYEIDSAEKCVNLINETKKEFAKKVDGDDYAQKEGEYPIFVGNLSNATGAVDCANEKWGAFDKNGYIIEITDQFTVVRGSCAEFTYYAVSKLMKGLIANDLNKFGTLCEKADYRINEEINREDYLNDVNKFPLVWEYDWEAPSWTKDFAEKTNQFKNKSGRVMVIGHRGDIECYPENSLEGIISAVRRGVDAVEIDIWQTKDGVYVLNHDLSLSDTTDWLKKKGKTIDGLTLPQSKFIYDWTYEQLLKLNIRYGNGEYSTASSELTDFKIATLKEALLVCKDKCYISMDRLNYKPNTTIALPQDEMGVNNPYWQDVYGLMKETKSFTSLYLNMALNQNDANALREIVDREQNVSTPTIFDRTGGHNCVNEWYTEFDCKDFDALYERWITEGGNQNGQTTLSGTYILCNRPSKAIEFVNKKYFINN